MENNHESYMYELEHDDEFQIRMIEERISWELGLEELYIKENND